MEEQLAREHAWWKLVASTTSAQTTKQITSSFQIQTDTELLLVHLLMYVCLTVCKYVYRFVCGEHHQLASSRFSELVVASRRSSFAISGEQLSRA